MGYLVEEDHSHARDGGGRGELEVVGLEDKVDLVTGRVRVKVRVGVGVGVRARARVNIAGRPVAAAAWYRGTAGRAC